MPKQLPISSVAILTSNLDIEEQLGRLLVLLASRGIQATAVCESSEIIEQLRRSEVGEVQCALVDGVTAGSNGAAGRYLDQVATLAAEDLDPIVLTRSPGPEAILAAFRAGAAAVAEA